MAETTKQLFTAITMLGASGIGKTCFLVGMYAIMREECPEGFTFSTDPDTDLKLDTWWNNMILAESEDRSEGTDRWPKPTGTDDFYAYPFRFNHGLTNRIINFDWLDYRGGALQDLADSQDVALLKTRLLNSDCVMLCVSGESLALAGRDREARAKAQIPRMLLFLTELAQDARPNRPDLPVVVIVITKYDHCKARGRDDLIAQVKHLFNPLFVAGAGWLVTICPVTLGDDLAKDRTGGEINPENVAVPVSFAAYCRLQEEADRLNNAADSARREAERAGKQSQQARNSARQLSKGFWSRNVFNRSEIAALQSESGRQDLKMEELILKSKESDAARAKVMQKGQLIFGKLIPAELPIFDNGQEVQNGS